MAEHRFRKAGVTSSTLVFGLLEFRLPPVRFSFAVRFNFISERLFGFPLPLDPVAAGRAVQGEA